MFTAALLIMMTVMVSFAIMVGISLLVKIWSINPDEFGEVQRIQGGFKSVISGKLRNPPNEFGDFRVLRGLRWDKKTGEYHSQSAVSSEGFRAAFPK